MKLQFYGSHFAIKSILLTCRILVFAALPLCFSPSPFLLFCFQCTNRPGIPSGQALCAWAFKRYVRHRKQSQQHGRRRCSFLTSRALCYLASSYCSSGRTSFPTYLWQTHSCIFSHSPPEILFLWETLTVQPTHWSPKIMTEHLLRRRCCVQE